MGVTENRVEVESVDLKRNLQAFVEAISPLGIPFCLNPHLERVPPENSEAKYKTTIATISESGFAGRLRHLVGRDNIVRILDAPPIYRDFQVDYLFVYQRPLKTEVFSRVLRFVQKVERQTGVRIYLAPEDDLTQWENE